MPHRPVDYNDPTVAAEVILLADLLLRLFARAQASPENGTRPDVSVLTPTAPYGRKHPVGNWLRLEGLRDLHVDAMGALTDEEYVRARARLLRAKHDTHDASERRDLSWRDNDLCNSPL